MKLLPCPFCDGEAVERHSHSHNAVNCGTCCASVPQSDLGYGDAGKLWNRRAALSHPSTAQGWKQIGWTCGDGDCGRIHEAPGADGSYAVPVYVPAPQTPEIKP